MKTTTVGILCLLILAGITAQITPRLSARSGAMFTGEITDSLCAVEGHHNDVITSIKNVSKANCTLACVRSGDAQFVLFDPRTKRTYKLDDQKQPEAFAGQMVIVLGTYDRETMTIHVANIRPVIQTAF